MKPFFLLTALLIAPMTSAQTLGIAITESSVGDYDTDVNKALQMGATATSLSLFWDEAMQGGTYMATPDWPAIANSYYPDKNISLVLSLSVIDTVADRRPAALRALPFDDPRVITAFTAFAAEVLSRMEDTDIKAILIGNEVDGYLQSRQDWQAFAAFFKAAKAAVHMIRPAAVIGFSTQWSGFQDRNRAQALAANVPADAIFINYYPLDSGFRVLAPDDISNQLQAMVAMANGKPVFLTETGYPSGGCGSSEALQTQYFQELMQAAHTLHRQIPLIMINWLHDIPDSAVDGYKQYYGVANPCFLRYLGTLGLRSYNGENKPAFTWFLQR